MPDRHPNEHLYPRVVPSPTSYSDRRDPDLPWGHWMRLVETGRGGVRDEDGTVWPSLREALWHGRLGMGGAEPPSDGPFFSMPRRRIDEMLDNLQGALAVAGRQGWQNPGEVAGQVEGGLHYKLWMRGQNLTTDVAYSPATRQMERLTHDRITDEGWAVFLMLKATRAEELHGVLPGSNAFETAGGEPMVEIANPMVNVAGARFLFERSVLARMKVISLLDRESSNGRMPMGRTIWSMAFERATERDRLFAWMCQRSDLWQRWGGIAGREADGLTQHLLATYIASVDWREVNGGAPVLAIADGTAKSRTRRSAA